MAQLGCSSRRQQINEKKKKEKRLQQIHFVISVCILTFAILLFFQMYGEKVEEAEELKLDLQDVKEMYKTQIDQLLRSQQQGL